MRTPGFQLRVGTLLGLVACVALNLWLFRLGTLAGLFGLNITRHVAVAYLCRATGINRRVGDPERSGPPRHHLPREGRDGVTP